MVDSTNKKKTEFFTQIKPLFFQLTLFFQVYFFKSKPLKYISIKNKTAKQTAQIIK